jgi:hypothetical protein
MKNKKEKFFKTQTTGWNTTTISYSGYGYGKHYGGMTNIYGYTPDGDTFDYIVTHHRSLIIGKLIESGEWWNIHPDVRGNYSTNGYTTRVGVRRANIARCGKMALSHHLITDDGSAAHEARVFLRNN